MIFATGLMFLVIGFLVIYGSAGRTDLTHGHSVKTAGDKLMALGGALLVIGAVLITLSIGIFASKLLP